MNDTKGHKLYDSRFIKLKKKQVNYSAVPEIRKVGGCLWGELERGDGERIPEC